VCSAGPRGIRRAGTKAAPVRSYLADAPPLKGQSRSAYRCRTLKRAPIWLHRRGRLWRRHL
jgi:hypothetical protein